MLQLIVFPEERRALIRYPKEARRPNKVIAVGRVKVDERWEKETRAYIYETLRRWVIQRNDTYKSARQVNRKNAHVAEKLLLTLIYYQHSSLRNLSRKIGLNYSLFIKLLPTKRCRNYPYAKEVISPILHWCQTYTSIHSKSS